MAKETKWYPEASYEPVANEISVNRDNPCELIRELISNSYDAGAKNITIAPLPGKRGLLYFDDGVGLSRDIIEDKGVSPYRAFFCIGKSTKVINKSIGHKCQGSKLTLASERLAVISKTAGDKKWFFKIIDNPLDVLSSDNKDCLKPEEVDDPVKRLEQALKIKGTPYEALLQRFDSNFFKTTISGTLIIVLGYKIEEADYTFYFGLDSGLEESHIYNYIRHHTKQGDVRYFSAAQGFSKTHLGLVSKKITQAKLMLLNCTADEDIKECIVPFGYNYLETAAVDTLTILGPSNVSELSEARFFARHAANFNHNGQQFDVIIAIDGNRRALKEYKHLTRQGIDGRRSGVLLSAQRGVIIASHGIRSAPANDIFTSPSLDSYKDLRKGVQHFTLFINGNFELITNRNGLAPNGSSLLKNEAFLAKIKAALDSFKDSNTKDGTLFKELLSRLKKEITAAKEESYIQNLSDLKDGMKFRTRFKLKSPKTSPISGKTFYCPERGEESTVGVLYTLFSYFVPPTSPSAAHWVHPLTYRGRGIDGVYLNGTHFESLEYKYEFSAAGSFNHPLNHIRRIVCWNIAPNVKLGTVINDDYGHCGKITKEIKIGKNSVGWLISNIERTDGTDSKHHDIEVVSLWSLIQSTYEIDITNPKGA